MPLISVIVPVYNAIKTLKQCVDSILCQGETDFELLLVDDGSNDGSSIICDECAKQDSRILVFHKPNGGVSSARNLGLEKAQGIWVAFIDSDDSISANFFEGVKDKKEDIIFLGYKTYYQGNILKDVSISEHFNNSFQNLISSNINNSIMRGPWGKFYKRKLISDLRFNIEMTIGEDVCFVFQYLSKCKNYSVKEDAEYIVTYCGVADDKKYLLSVEKAIYSLKCIHDAFDIMKNIHGLSERLFLPYINYFKRLSKYDWIENKSKWYDNSEIKAFYKYVWTALSIKQKIHLFVAYVLKK